MKLITREEQLKNKANFLDKNGKLFLVRCMNCGDSERGRENWIVAVANGECAWCGWGCELRTADPLDSEKNSAD